MNTENGYHQFQWFSKYVIHKISYSHKEEGYDSFYNAIHWITVENCNIQVAAFKHNKGPT